MISLSAYTISIVDKINSKRKALNSFDGKSDFLKVVYDYINQNLKNPITYPDDKRLMRFKLVDPISKRYMVGRLETGEYGYTSDLYDTVGKKQSHNRTKAEAEMLPFWLYIQIPAGSERGAIVFQRFKQFGVRSYFSTALSHYFEKTYPGFKLEIKRALPAQVISEILDKGEIKNLRFVKLKASQDICDAVGSLDPNEVAEEVELVVKARRKTFFGSLAPLKKELQKIKPNFKSIIEIPNFEYDTLKIDVLISGHKRRIDLGKLFRLSGNIDITDDVEIDNSGHPEKESFKTLAAELANSILLE